MESDLRAVLQYVPAFRGKVFVVVLNGSRMPEQALAEVLLDLRALQQVGVRLLVLSIGSGEAELASRLVEGEMKWQGLPGDASVDSVQEILDRGQLAFLELPGLESFDDRMISLAAGLSAAKLITFWPTDALLAAQGLHALSREQAATSQNGAAELLHAAAAVCERGIPRVHLLDECRHGVLLDELFSNEGVGVMIHADDYLSIRPLQEDDIPELLAMIGRSMRDAHLIPRTYDQVENALNEFLVLTVDDNVVGCVALHEYDDHVSAEVACLYVKQTHESGGYGRALVNAAETRARERGIPWVFALTNRALGFFTRVMGYYEIDPAELPHERRERLAASGRASTVIRKDLT